MERIIPLIIRRVDGTVVDVASQNSKAYTKSIESGNIWHLHPDTGRVLPFGDSTPFLSLKKSVRWNEAVIESPEENRREITVSVPVETSKETSPLRRLTAVIRERRISRPQGSYTTHLFDSGGVKIRKKLGEEAVELVLASGEDEIVFEAADLIYHLLVLLENEGIEFGRVLSELSRRAE